MNEKKLKSAAEAILFACGTPVETERIAQTLAIGTDKAEELCMQLKEEYAKRESGIRIVRLGKSFQMCTEEEYADPIRTIMDIRRNTPLSQAASEVLAVIAYNQPVTKAFVEQIRGVDCSGVMASLCQKGLVEEGPFRPETPFHKGCVGHHLRSGGHSLNHYDWGCYMDFADRHGWRASR